MEFLNVFNLPDWFPYFESPDKVYKIYVFKPKVYRLGLLGCFKPKFSIDGSFVPVYDMKFLIVLSEVNVIVCLWLDCLAFSLEF